MSANGESKKDMIPTKPLKVVSGARSIEDERVVSRSMRKFVSAQMTSLPPWLARAGFVIATEPNSDEASEFVITSSEIDDCYRYARNDSSRVRVAMTFFGRL